MCTYDKVPPPWPGHHREASLLRECVAKFVQRNGLDEQCQATLQSLAPEEQAAIVGQGEETIQVDPTKGSASGIVMGRIKKLRRGEQHPNTLPVAPRGQQSFGHGPPQWSRRALALRVTIQIYSVTNRGDALCAALPKKRATIQ